jgi:23S rRNA pseudouridine1911/1915/1917 synthase
VTEDRADRRNVEVSIEFDGVRLDSFLAALLPDRSRSHLAKLIKEGHVTGPMKSLRASTPVKAGQTFGITLPEAGPATAVAEDLPLTILYEDPDVVVIDKAAGMVVHPAAGHSSGTVVNALLHHVDDLSGVGGQLRPGIVHRLDRGTSGVMVVAKNDTAHKELSRQFHDREVEKEYFALVWGTVHAGKRIDAPIGRDPGDRQKMSTRARRSRSAVTRITRAEYFRGVSLLQVAIATGRTHQIRVHLNAIGHPIVGDPTYGGVRRHVPNDIRAVQRLERPFLHAWKLAFTHPTDGRRLEFESPLPADLHAVIDAIRDKQRDPDAGVEE